VGARGPAPKPTALKVLEGNPGKRALNKAEPKPRPLMPRMPEWLVGLAADFWQRNGKMLHKLGVLTEADTESFAKLCQSYQSWREAINARELDLAAVQSGQKLMVDWHLAIAAQNAAKLYAADLQQFGMTPASRTRIRVAGTDEEGEIDDLL